MRKSRQMHPYQMHANQACLDAIDRAMAKEGLSPEEKCIIDAVEALRHGLYGDPV